MIIKDLKNFLINLFIVSSIFLLDRFSKIYVIYLNEELNYSEIFSSKFLNINLIWNQGIAFGLLSFKKDFLYTALTIVIIIIIFIILFIVVKSVGLKKYSLLMILGGALGNVFDRIFNNAVPDFIDFHVGNYHWFIFNVADIFITLGVILMILLEFTANNKNKKL